MKKYDAYLRTTSGARQKYDEVAFPHVRSIGARQKYDEVAFAYFDSILFPINAIPQKSVVAQRKLQNKYEKTYMKRI